jgi:hypothetical protein
MANGLLAVTQIDGVHRQHLDYPILPGDLLLKEDDGTYIKVCPGVAMTGFQLTDEQVATLKPVEFVQHGLNYVIDDPNYN